MKEDTPLPRAIKIGTATVGLVGLDVALRRLYNQPELPEKEAIDYLFDEVERQNYVPATAEEQYRKALRQLYRSLRGEEVEQQGLRIRILGPGCVSCRGGSPDEVDRARCVRRARGRRGAGRRRLRGGS